MTHHPVMPNDHQRTEPCNAGSSGIRRATLGDGGGSRSQAMVALARSSLPTRERDLENILVSVSTPSRYRHLAALLLGQVNTSLAVSILTDALDGAEPRLCGTIARGLGRLGDAAAYAALAKAGKGLGGVPLAQIQFAQRLIAHRVDLEVPVTDPEAVVIPFAPDEALPVPFVAATACEIDDAFTSLAADPYGIELNEHAAYAMRCGPSRLVLALNRAIGDPFDARCLRQRKWIAGVVARQSDSGPYSVMLLLLTAPVRHSNGCTIEAWRPTGTRAVAGAGVEQNDGLLFSVRGIERRAGYAAWFEGLAGASQVEMRRSLSGVLLHRVHAFGGSSRPEADLPSVYQP